MTLTLNIFGFEIGSLRLDLPVVTPEQPSQIDQAAKSLSRWFFDRMIR